MPRAEYQTQLALESPELMSNGPEDLSALALIVRVLKFFWGFSLGMSLIPPFWACTHEYKCIKVFRPHECEWMDSPRHSITNHSECVMVSHIQLDQGSKQLEVKLGLSGTRQVKLEQ